jgi:hypothetical protein
MTHLCSGVLTEINTARDGSIDIGHGVHLCILGKCRGSQKAGNEERAEHQFTI